MADKGRPVFYNMFPDCTIIETVDVTDPIQRECGVSVYVALGTDRSSFSPDGKLPTEFPGGEFATWLISNNHPDGEFHLGAAEYITSEFGYGYAYWMAKNAFRERVDANRPGKSLGKEEIFPL